MRTRAIGLLFLACLVAVCGEARGDGIGATQVVNWRDGSLLVLVPGGRFVMGSNRGAPPEAPPHTVRVRPFYMARNEVTNGQFARFVSATGYRTTAEQKGSSIAWTGRRWEEVRGADWRHPNGVGTSAGANLPVVNVSWYDATQYAAWAGLRLPTEEEWEFAARGTDQRIWCWLGDFKPANARTSVGASVGGPSNVGSHLGGQSPFGMFDMIGNVWEWTSSLSERYAGNHDNTTTFYGSDFRILRGGSWSTTSPWDCTTTARTRDYPTITVTHFGFRCARDAATESPH